MVKRIEHHTAFTDADAIARSTGDWNYCSVIAAHLLTDKSFDECQRVFDTLGRNRKKPTPLSITRLAYPALGFDMREIKLAEQHDRFFSKYPGQHKFKLHLTSRHPHRFANVWRDNAPRRLLAHSRNHAWAIIDGQTIDYSINRSLRIQWLWEITPK